MIASLRGKASKSTPGLCTIDVNGVGYLVTVPLDVWDSMKEGHDVKLEIVTYVREDRLDLFGFLDAASRTLFIEVTKMSGVGPKMGLEICSVPRNLFLTAMEQEDFSLLSSIKGVGKKTAEKLLLDMKALNEKSPELFGELGDRKVTSSEYDRDAIAALNTLGYDMPTIMNALKNLPEDCETTEDRVSAALRSL